MTSANAQSAGAIKSTPQRRDVEKNIKRAQPIPTRQKQVTIRSKGKTPEQTRRGEARRATIVFRYSTARKHGNEPSHQPAKETSQTNQGTRRARRANKEPKRGEASEASPEGHTHPTDRQDEQTRTREEKAGPRSGDRASRRTHRQTGKRGTTHSTHWEEEGVQA